MTAPGIFAASAITVARRPPPPRPQVVERAQNLFFIAPLTPLDLWYIPLLIWNSQSEDNPMHSLNIPETSNPIAMKTCAHIATIRAQVAPKTGTHAMKTRTRTHIAPPRNSGDFGD